MDSVIATTLRTLILLYRAFYFQLLCWFELYRYVYLMWCAALGSLGNSKRSA